MFKRLEDGVEDSIWPQITMTPVALARRSTGAGSDGGRFAEGGSGPYEIRHVPAMSAIETGRSASAPPC